MNNLPIIKLERGISEIGQRLVKCKNYCPGIILNPVKGIIPRCLILEVKKRSSGRGSVIVGINPGNSNLEEQRYYLRNGNNYEQLVKYFEDHLAYKYPYYNWLRDFVTALGLSGPILWTELVKCESQVDFKGGKLPIATRNFCSEKYLLQELKIIPLDWPIIAVSRPTYRSLINTIPPRPIIGVPHPTSSQGNFNWLFSNFSKRQLYPEFQLDLDSILFKGSGNACWLKAKKERRTIEWTLPKP